VATEHNRSSYNNWDGFVHFANWRGCVPNAVIENRPFQANQPFPVSTAKDICAIDSECKVFGLFGGTPSPQTQFGTSLDNGGAANTTYGMLLGIKGHANATPAAFCTAGSSGGNLPNVSNSKNRCL
jgi:hypothetical protein